MKGWGLEMYPPPWHQGDQAAEGTARPWPFVSGLTPDTPVGPRACTGHPPLSFLCPGPAHTPPTPASEATPVGLGRLISPRPIPGGVSLGRAPQETQAPLLFVKLPPILCLWTCSNASTLVSLASVLRTFGLGPCCLSLAGRVAAALREGLWGGVRGQQGGGE